MASVSKLPDLDVAEGEGEEGEEVLPPPCVDLTNYPLKIGRPGTVYIIFKIVVEDLKLSGIFLFKRGLTRDFRLQVFFMNQYLPCP